MTGFSESFLIRCLKICSRRLQKTYISIVLLHMPCAFKPKREATSVLTEGGNVAAFYWEPCNDMSYSEVISAILQPAEGWYKYSIQAIANKKIHNIFVFLQSEPPVICHMTKYSMESVEYVIGFAYTAILNIRRKP